MVVVMISLIAPRRPTKKTPCFAIAQVEPYLFQRGCLSGFPQQKFQVPKMEVLNLIRLFGGGFSLT